MPSAISEYTPQLVRDEESARRVRAARRGWGVALVGAAGMVGLIVLAPLLRAGGAPGAAALIYDGFRVACHQMNARSFHVEGFQLAVCARCFGLYVGALVGVAAYPLARPIARRDFPERAWLLAAAVPTSIDFALGFFGVWENTHMSRFLTASLLGVVAAFYIVPGVVDLSLTPWRHFFRSGLPREG
ncbi:MAG: hypothetical protein QOC99_2627 [Acidobacteriota bacterium]|jgi:uncharacterized membrane protein|nr:hypothetical protein [Acidobacteriota bacterium]MDT7780115.1 hypothetical protein [Acidobacteriota bacterium]